jgi:hypothetical protein
MTPNRYEFDLASTKLLPTNSLRLAKFNASTSLRSIAAVAKKSALAFANADAWNCDKMEYGDAVHSCFAVEEIDLICNHKFV